MLDKPFDYPVVCVAGLPFSIVSLNDLVEDIFLSMDEGRRLFLSTPNLNFLVASRSDSDFRRSVEDSHVSIPDGMPIIWLSKFLRLGLGDRVAGSDLFELLINLSNSNRDSKIFFFGGTEGVAEIAFQKLNEKFINAKSVGFCYPGFSSIDEMSSIEFIQKINHSNAGFLVVALGAKKGQQWISRNFQNINVPVVSHLGAVVNFMAGTVERAPILYRRLGFEWLWRIKEEPNLWLRYFKDFFGLLSIFFTMIIPCAINEYFYRPKKYLFNKSSCDCFIVGGSISCKLTGVFGRDNIHILRLFFDSLDSSDLILDLSQCLFLDAYAFGEFLRVASILRKRGSRFLITNCSKRMTKIFAYYGVSHLLSR